MRIHLGGHCDHLGNWFVRTLVGHTTRTYVQRLRVASLLGFGLVGSFLTATTRVGDYLRMCWRADCHDVDLRPATPLAYLWLYSL